MACYRYTTLANGGDLPSLRVSSSQARNPTHFLSHGHLKYMTQRVLCQAEDRIRTYGVLSERHYKCRAINHYATSAKGNNGRRDFYVRTESPLPSSRHRILGPERGFALPTFWWSKCDISHKDITGTYPLSVYIWSIILQQAYLDSNQGWGFRRAEW